jgi:hypothetical protein
MPKSEHDQTMTMEQFNASIERSRKSIAETLRILKEREAERQEREAERRPRPHLTLIRTDDEGVDRDA